MYVRKVYNKENHLIKDYCDYTPKSERLKDFLNEIYSKNNTENNFD